MSKNFWRMFCLPAALFAAFQGSDSSAQVVYNNAVGSGNWNAPATWSGGAPTTSTPVAIDGGRVVTIDASGPSTNLLDLGTVAGETGSINMTGGELYINDPASSEPNIPSLRLGQVPGSTGNFTISGGTVFVDAGAGNDLGVGEVLVGDNGTGTLTMTGGDVIASDEIWVGVQPGSVGTINISGGTLNAAGRSILVGTGGTGNLNVSGTASVVANFDLLVGQHDANITQSGGTIDVGIVFSNIFGGGGNVAFNQTGGTFNARIAFVMGQGPGTTTMTHSGGVMNCVLGNGDFVVSDGTGNTSTYTISGTAQTNIGHTMLVGVFEGSNGTVNQNGGTVAYQAGLPVEGRDGIIVGRDGVGTYNMTAGSISVPNIFLGDFDSSTGTMKISGGTVNLTGNFNVGGALASNAAPDRVEPDGSNGPQGQALDANGILTVSGNAATINVAGNFLANPADKGAARNGAGQENSATLNFEIGSAAGTSLINVAGIADLDGAVIDLDFLSGFVPAVNSTFDLIKAASFGATGTGTTQNVGTGKGFTLASEDTGVFSLAVVASGGFEYLRATYLGGGGGLAADFNHDGFVNATDLATWKTAYGSTAAGDANSDGVTNGADFLIWQRQFTGPAAAPAAASVPEPASLALIAVCLAGLAGVHRRS